MLTVIFDLLNLILVSMYNSGDSINISGPLFCNLQNQAECFIIYWVIGRIK